MFETNSGLSVGPFQSSVPQYDYWSASHTLATERLRFAVGSAILFTVFTGDAGSGKSTIVRKVVSDAQTRSLIGVSSYGPLINIDPCLAILKAFGADPGIGDKASHRRVLQQSLEAARNEYGMPILILDDAHQLNDEQVSKLFDLAGYEEGPQNALFKIILVGHPELLVRLGKGSGDLLGPSFALEPMSESDAAGYIKYRLKAAGIDNVPFDDDAFSAIQERTGGNPQQINLLCKALLDEAATLDILRIDSKWVRDCKIAAVQWFDAGLETCSPMGSVSSSTMLSEELTSELPQSKGNGSTLVSKPKAPSGSAKKGSAECKLAKDILAKSDTSSKSNERPQDNPAKENRSHFKSSRTAQVGEPD